MNKYEITCGQCIRAFPDFIIEKVIKSATYAKVIYIAFLFYAMTQDESLHKAQLWNKLFIFFFSLFFVSFKKGTELRQ